MSVAQVVTTLATRLALVAAGLLTSIITARYLGPDGRGQFFFWTTVAALVVQFGNGGLQASNAYLLTRRGADAGVLSANSLLVSLVAGLLLGVLALAVLGLGNPDRQVVGARAAAVLMLAVSGLYIMLGSNLLVALGRVGEFNRVELVVRYGAVLVLLATAWAWRQVDSLLVALGLVSLASCAFVLWRLQQVAPLGRPSTTVLREGIGYGLRAYLAAGLGMLVARSNAFLLEPRVDAAEYGTWSIAMQFFDVMNLIPASVALVLLPRILRAERPHDMLGPQMLLVGGLLTVVAAGFVLVGAPVIEFLYGAAFVPAYDHLLWGLPGLLGLGLTAILSQYLAAKGLPWSLVWVWLVVALLQGGLAWTLIPHHGVDGAMLSLSIAYLLGLGLIAALVHNLRKRDA
jgi:antigen flippase